MSDLLKSVPIAELQALTLDQLSALAGVRRTLIMDMVEHGIIEPENDSSRFSATCVTRITVTKRLQKDLDLNLAGAALVLDLMDQIKQLRQQSAFSRWIDTD